MDQKKLKAYLEKIAAGKISPDEGMDNFRALGRLFKRVTTLSPTHQRLDVAWTFLKQVTKTVAKSRL